ncbi:hypothetical protein [Pseudoalteromonas phenolica]|uniref:hypothetical protein n=1 Tax=Pseudoalteromonas phenolica TaxID=161398 RepID=UPI00110AABB4|nr:hypothetical protein [Pseudoalteromonas phenolica]TMO56369.1 hypothetical protein CWC21_06620 [Pseudoalteromonas phenolica]
MKIIRIAALGVVLALTVGCKTTVEPETITLDTNIEGRTFVFKKLDGAGKNVVTASSVKQAVAAHIKAHAGYGHCRSSMFGGNCARKTTADIKKYWGSSVNSIENEYRITYFNGEKISGGGDYRTTVNVNLPFTINETDESFTVKLHPATSAQVTPMRDALFMEISPLVNGDKLKEFIDDVMVKGMPVINGHVYKEGEFNVEFDPESVKTNFVREFKTIKFSDAKNGTIASSHFDIYKGRKKVGAKVQIYLYQGHSKVEYSVKYSVTANGDGSADYDDGALLNEVATLLEKVAKS